MIIKTKNLIIRNFQEKDAVGLLEYLSHPRVNCFADDRLYSEESALAYISNTPKDMLRGQRKNLRDLLFRHKF